MNMNVKFVDAIYNRELFHAMYKPYSDELARYCTRLAEQPMTEMLIDEQYFNDVQLFKYFIEINGETVGFIILQYVDESFYVVKPLWYIVEFYILPKYRRKHYGELAVKFFLDFYHKDFFYFVLKRNLPAQRFWKNITRKLKLKQVERPDILNDDDELDIYAFEVDWRKDNE